MAFCVQAAVEPCVYVRALATMSAMWDRGVLQCAIVCDRTRRGPHFRA